ncbi:cell division protein [Ligilactobacillus ceti DSM 22408]|uniref:Probable peptidoglycan glycosyltransferase FtsW n=2 Tax=Ligilactobacillus TaxID=2767887 RepID=A0A0R2KHS6_9LACO|nr:FtsW/RodA/SpoVE family cell cycle protein [Ligilactobacillus ceti]KRN88928.1 cell division protein [Ligilactobacillus ceti DSM 22408]
MIKKLRNKFKYFDWKLFIPFITLCIISIMAVYSASGVNAHNSAIYFLKQTIYVGLGVCIVLVMAHLKIDFLKNPKFLFGNAVFLIVLLLIALNSASINGAKGWISTGLFNIQPAEMCKLFLALYMAQKVADRAHKREIGAEIKNTFPIIIVVGMLFLILIEPDLGGFLINLSIVLVVYLAGLNDFKKSFKLLATGFTVALVGLQVLRFFNPFAYGPLKHWGYMYQRFTAYFTPFKYANAEGKQLVNSYYAISNGGIFGVGIGNSIQKRGYLPEPHTDFILSVIAEEKGLIGTVVVLILLFLLIGRIFKIGIRSQDLYKSLICYGIGTFMFIETMFNVGGVNGLLPITGVTLPFVSYGGSSMVVLTASLGIVMNISANQRRQKK